MRAIFKPKRTILLTLMETSQKSFKESKKIKRELERKQTSANSILFFFFALSHTKCGFQLILMMAILKFQYVN